MKLFDRTRLALLRNPNPWRFSFSSSSSVQTQRLYKRLSPAGDPNASVVPILNQWVQEGNTVNQEYLQRIVQELRFYRRFNHALQVSQWISDKCYMPPSSKDIAARLDLISRVHGLNKAQEFFDNTPEKLKRFVVYASLLSCYAREIFVEKAEAVMEQIQGAMKLENALCHNILMSMYNRIGDYEKLDSLVSEMEREGIAFDLFTYSIRLGACASRSDTDGIRKLVEEVESKPELTVTWNFYSSAVHGFIKVGSVDKADEMLKKLEKNLSSAKRKALAFDYLLTSYTQIGKKDELYRVWNLYKTDGVYNKGYKVMISSLLKFDDIESAEKIYAEWEQTRLRRDPSIPDMLIAEYCGKNLPDKAKEVAEKEILKGTWSQVESWSVLASRYLENDQIAWAVHALKKAKLVCPPGEKPGKKVLLRCLMYLEGEGDIEQAEEFVNSLKSEKVFSEAACDRILYYSKA